MQRFEKLAGCYIAHEWLSFSHCIRFWRSKGNDSLDDALCQWVASLFVEIAFLIDALGLDTLPNED